MKRLMRAALPWVRTVLVVLVLGVIVFFILANASSIGKLRSGLDTANQKLESVGLEPVEVEGPEGVQGPPGEPGRPPSAGEIALAVANYCSVYDCQGPAGADGVSPSPEQIAEAVTAYCEAHGGCAGPTGSDGTDGAQGSTGPKGDTGKQGPPGEQGADGRGISSIACTAENDWSVTYTDGTTQTVEGPCRIPTEAPPNPDETEIAP